MQKLFEEEEYHLERSTKKVKEHHGNLEEDGMLDSSTSPAQPSQELIMQVKLPTYGKKPQRNYKEALMDDDNAIYFDV